MTELLKRWAPRALTVVAILAVAVLALGGIRDQLLGRTVLAGTDGMTRQIPYVLAGIPAVGNANLWQSDIYSAELPSTMVFVNSLAHGTLAMWNPYVAGGTPLGGITNNALASPVTFAYYVLPNWLAPAYERLAELVCGLAGCYFLFRRWRLGKPAALLGGMVFVGGAFMVAWQDWPQTRVAAFIPLLFWATERFVQERRVRDVAVLGVVTASMLLGGFPAVEGYALLTVGCYAVVRVLGESWGELRTDLRRARRRIVLGFVGFGAGLASGLGLALFQILPFSAFYNSWLIEGRGQDSARHLDPMSLVTAFAPWAYGGVKADDPQKYYLPINAVESLSYVGAAAAVLILVAVLSVRRGRARLPRGVWVFLVVVSCLWTMLIYSGGPLLDGLQHLPVLRSLFGANFIGRARSIWGFLLACLAAVGFDLAVERGVLTTSSSSSWGSSSLRPLSVRGRRALVAGVGAVALFVVLRVWGVIDAGRVFAATTSTQASALFAHEVRIGLLLVGVAAVCVTVLRFVRSAPVRLLASSVVLVLVAGQGMQFIQGYSSSAAKSTFYPVTDTQEFLAANLGSQRYVSTTAGVVLGTDAAYGLRTLNGHTFLNANLATMVRGMSPSPVVSATQLAFTADAGQISSPILDRLGVAYFVASAAEQVLGTASKGVSDGSSVTVPAGSSVTVAVPVSGPLRAVGFVPTGTVAEALSFTDPNSWVSVAVTDASGTLVASAQRMTVGMTSGTEFDIPVAADTVAAGTALTATLTFHTSAGVSVAGAAGGGVALSAVAGGDDGFRLVQAGSSVVYERLDALPRVRWASSAVVVPEETSRVSLLESGTLPTSTVVLGAEATSGTGSGESASVEVTSDGTDSVSAAVDAAGAGYLVVADADQVGFEATVDGAKAELVDADEGVVAVAVPAGTHTVSVAYSSPDGGVGGYVSLATGAVMLAAVGGEFWLRRRRRVVVGGVARGADATEEAGSDVAVAPDVVGAAAGSAFGPELEVRAEAGSDVAVAPDVVGAAAGSALGLESGSHDETGPDVREPALSQPERGGS